MANFSALDAQYMARALKLAAYGRYSTTPNPCVGCVILGQNGQIIGEGWHQKAGEAHAEVIALQQAGEGAQGASAYVTLEPCSHHGRTPPCADALIKAGIKRVVVASTDPNPQVNNGGIERLRSHGIEVEVGLHAAQSDQLNVGFLQRMRKQKPRIVAKLASSIDGKIALANGASKWISSAHSRADVQIHRASACAILTGADTIINDNPQLNVRAELLPEKIANLFALRKRQPDRIIIDSRNRLDHQYQIFHDTHPCIVLNHEPNSALPAKVQQVQLPRDGAHLCLKAIIKCMAHATYNTVWLECGAQLAGAFLQASLLDELILYQAPIIMGNDAKDMLTLDTITSMQATHRLQQKDLRQLGDDIKRHFVISS